MTAVDGYEKSVFAPRLVVGVGVSASQKDSVLDGNRV